MRVTRRVMLDACALLVRSEARVREARVRGDSRCSRDAHASISVCRQAAHDADEATARQQAATAKLQEVSERLAATETTLASRSRALDEVAAKLGAADAAAETASLRLDATEADVSDLTRERARLEQECAALEERWRSASAAIREHASVAVQTATSARGAAAPLTYGVACQARAQLRHAASQCDGDPRASGGEGQAHLIVAAATAAALDEEAQLMQHAVTATKSAALLFHVQSLQMQELRSLWVRYV